MASDSEDPEATADRLEAALKRIALAAASRDAALKQEPHAAMNTGEVAARLDGLIDRLRTALGTKAD